MAESKVADFSPGRILFASFAFVITVGTVLLSLPQAHEVPISFLDTFFTATSATCVTGLQVIPLSHFTFFGKCVILGLIQIGGLGLMTLSFFLISLILKLGMATRLIAGQLLEFELWGQIKTFLFLIIGLTFGIELAGALALYPIFHTSMSQGDAVFYSLFHSVSAFCNAGTSLFHNDMIQYAHHPVLLLILAFLVFAGGIGFVVWYDIFKFVKRLLSFEQQPQTSHFALSLHSKIVLVTSGILIVLGALFIWGIERLNLFKDFSLFHSLTNALFCSVSSRSAGFSTVDLSMAHHGTLFILLFLMFIGASSNSTGSGLKTSTFAIFVASVATILRNRQDVEIFGRTIPTEQIYKVMALIAIAATWLFSSTFILLIFEKKFSFIQILFEAVSAFGTVGFSTGITSQLCIGSKVILILSMIAGRLGLLTLVLALRRKKVRSLYRYPEERVIIG